MRTLTFNKLDNGLMLSINRNNETLELATKIDKLDTLISLLEHFQLIGEKIYLINLTKKIPNFTMACGVMNIKDKEKEQ